MCSTPSYKAPPPAPTLPEAAKTPSTPSTRSGGMDDTRRKRTYTGASTGSTILTSSQGVTNGAVTTGKTLLGS